MGLVETAMGMRGSLREIKQDDLSNLGFDPSKKFSELVVAYNIYLGIVKDKDFENMVSKAQGKMESMQNATGGFAHNIQKPLLELISKYQTDTKVKLTELIKSSKESIKNIQTKLKSLKVGETLKDDKGKEVKVSAKDKKEIEEMLKENEKGLPKLEKQLIKLKGEATKIKEAAEKVGVVSEKSLANMICSKKGTGVVGSLKTVSEFISDAIKSGKAPNDKDVDAMYKTLADEKQKKSYAESCARLNGLANSEVKSVASEWSIDYTVMKSHITGAFQDLKNNLQEMIKNKKVTKKDMDKLSDDTNKRLQTIIDNCEAYCTPKGNEDLIKLCKLMCGFMGLCEFTDVITAMSSGGGGDLGDAVGWIVLGVFCVGVFGGLLYGLGCLLVATVGAALLATIGAYVLQGLIVLAALAVVGVGVFLGVNWLVDKIKGRHANQNLQILSHKISKNKMRELNEYFAAVETYYYGENKHDSSHEKENINKAKKRCLRFIDTDVLEQYLKDINIGKSSKKQYEKLKVNAQIEVLNAIESKDRSKENNTRR